ncbi:YibE/F family protein [Azotosporobacter soli]|uniref:YibE/F family protein n=1 Tax=Azotosporobacter soli TaxID=3055040 RepID=UPI0031FE449B
MKRRRSIIILFTALLGFALFAAWLQQSNRPLQGNQEMSAVVTAVDNQLETFGLVSEGSQLVSAIITEGPLKGQALQGYNHVQGKLELDHIMKPGDSALFAVQIAADGSISQAYVIEYDRHYWEYLLFALFVLTLLLFAGTTGLKACASFVLSLVILWQFFLPGLLKGYPPIPFALLTLALISALIIFLVLGVNRKAFTAFGGTLAGLTMTTVFTLYFGEHFHLNGATAAFAESFLYSGSYNISLKELFYAAIILGATGAAVDVAIDVAAAMEEVTLHRPDISRDELVKSGLNVGRAVIGAMTTTLLLAYSGGYILMLLLFLTKDMTLLRILNMNYVAAEILRTLTGSIGLILVVPFTALLGGYLLIPDKTSASPSLKNIWPFGHKAKEEI